MSNLHTIWSKKAVDALVGRMIVNAYYPTNKQINDLQLPGCGVMFTLDNGTVWMPFADSEGNDAGVLVMVDINEEYFQIIYPDYPQHLPKL